jgi:hypothetical protein
MTVGLRKKTGVSVDWKAAVAFLLCWEQLPVCHMETYGLPSSSLENYQDLFGFNHLALWFANYMS